MTEVKLTKYSHGAGCGCKISPQVLSQILGDRRDQLKDPRLLVGNTTNDYAAVYDNGNGTATISTTDFFMPIVDDPFEFGAIAATNALSDIYAMGGIPIMALSILGWPVDKIPSEIAGKVIDGARTTCRRAGITLAGGHSIDSPEPIFGLAATGTIRIEQLKKNSNAKEGSRLYLTKRLGVGILTTAQKKGQVSNTDLSEAKESMLALNDIGIELGKMEFVNALTDVTGFGLLGHLIEMAQFSNLSAELDFNSIPTFDSLEHYIQLGCIPGGSNRNWDSYGNKVEINSEIQKVILSDPQTSGGLLISVDPGSEAEFENRLGQIDTKVTSIGKLINRRSKVVYLSSPST